MESEWTARTPSTVQLDSPRTELGLSSDSHCLPLFIYTGAKFREDRDLNSHIGEADVIKQGNITTRQQALV